MASVTVGSRFADSEILALQRCIMSAEMPVCFPGELGLSMDAWKRRVSAEATRRVAVLLKILNTPNETAQWKLNFVEETMDTFTSHDFLEVELMALQRTGQGDDSKKRLAECSQQWLLCEQTKHLQGSTPEVKWSGADKRQRLDPGESALAAEPFAAAASAATSLLEASTRSREETLQLIEANKEAARMRKKALSDQAMHEQKEWFL
jgi:hypothetical protein